MSSVANSCVLCAEDGGTVVWQDQTLRVVTVDDPDLPGYSRVIWHTHAAEMSSLSGTDQHHVMDVVLLVESVQRRILGTHKVNLASLGNMTPHLHWHIMPRWRDDPWYPDSIWAARRERDADTLSQWQQRHEILATLQGEYVAALKLSLEQKFGRSLPVSTRRPPEETPKMEHPSNRLQTLPSDQLAELHPGWRNALDTPAARAALGKLDSFLQERLRAGATIFPHRIFRALEAIAPHDVRVVILGQDPYHGPGQAQGLAFSVPDTCPTPPSLRNMFNELAREYPDSARRRRNDLSDWAKQGVLLLNTSLTVEQGAAGSHARKGWEVITDAIIDTVAQAPQPVVFLLWGNHAQSKLPALEAKGRQFLAYVANHPSPLSALRPPRPFIGCGHFSKANAWLESMNEAPIDWLGAAN